MKHQTSGNTRECCALKTLHCLIQRSRVPRIRKNSRILHVNATCAMSNVQRPVVADTKEKHNDSDHNLVNPHNDSCTMLSSLIKSLFKTQANSPCLCLLLEASLLCNTRENFPCDVLPSSCNRWTLFSPQFPSRP